MSSRDSESSEAPAGPLVARIRNRLTRWLDQFRGSATLHRTLLALQRIGHGKGRNIYIFGIAVLVPVWLIGTFLAMHAHLEQNGGGVPGGQSPVEQVLDSAYWTFLSFGGVDTFAQSLSDAAAPEEVSASLLAVRWLGILVPLWLGLPPLFSWLIRVSERGSVRHVLSGHYVLLGYGRVGQALAHDLLSRPRAEQRAIVIVDNTSETAHHYAVRRAGAIVLEYDAQDPAVLDEVAAHRARGILVATGSSSRNIDITGELAGRLEFLNRSDLELSPRHRPKIVPHIAERHMMEWVASDAGDRWRAGAKEDASEYRPQIWPFSAEQTAARHVLTEYPIAEHARLRRAKRPHIVLLGFDSVGEWLLPMLFQMGRMQGLAGPRVTLILNAAGGEREVARVRGWIQRRYPFLSGSESGLEELRSYLDIHFTIETYNFDQVDAALFDLATPLSADITEVDRILSGDEPLPEDLDRWVQGLDLQNPDDPVTSVFIGLGEDDRNLDVTLQLQELINRDRRWLAPTFVRLRHDSGLEEVLNRSGNVTRLADVTDDFGQDASTCTHAEIFDSCQEAAAQEAHNTYLASSGLEELAAPPEKEDQRSEQQLELRTKLCERADTMSAAELIGALIEGRVPAEQDGTKDGNGERTLKDLLAGLERLEKEQRSADAQTKVADDAWTDLHFEYVNSNRDQVDHLPVKLRGLGYRPRTRPASSDVRGSRIVGPWPIPEWKHGHALTFREACRLGGHDAAYDLPKRITDTAALEHKRWITERLLGGWRPGAARDNTRKKHPSLRPNIEQAPGEVRKDQRTTLNVHDILAKSDAAVDWHPECSIGVLELGATLNDPSIIQDILHRIVSHEARALATQFRSLWDGTEMPPEDVRDDLAISILTPSLEAAERYMGPCQTKDLTNPIRTIVPRALVSPTPGEVLDFERPDSWEIDVLPEGLPTLPLSDSYDLQWKEDGGRGLSTDKAHDADKDALGEARQKVVATHLDRIDWEYIALRASWLVVVGPDAEPTAEVAQAEALWRALSSAEPNRKEQDSPHQQIEQRADNEPGVGQWEAVAGHVQVKVDREEQLVHVKVL